MRSQSACCWLMRKGSRADVSEVVPGPTRQGILNDEPLDEAIRNGVGRRGLVAGVTRIVGRGANCHRIGNRQYRQLHPGFHNPEYSVNSPMDVYFFGVLIDSGRDIVGSPAGFDPNIWTNWNNSLYGGSNLNYNNIWIDNTYTYLPSGSTLGGFSVYTTDAVAPTSVNWFAYAVGYDNEEGNYNGSDYFNSEESWLRGSHRRHAVPEPSAMVMAGIATVIGGLGYKWRRRRAAA